MGLFRVAKCKACGHKSHDYKPTRRPGACPKCSQPMEYLPKWYIAFYQNNRRFIQSVSESKPLAMSTLAKRRVEIAENRFLDIRRGVSWDRMEREYLQWAETNTSQGTLKAYRRHLAKLRAFFRDHDLGKIDVSLVERFKASLVQQGLKPATVNVHLGVLKGILSLTKKSGYIQSAPEIKALKVSNARERFLSEEEIRRLLDVAPMPFRLMILLGVTTGIRKEGVVRLQWTEIKDGTISLRSKGGRLISVPISQEVQQAIVLYRAGLRVMSRYVFPSPGNLDQPRAHGNVYGITKAFRDAGLEGCAFHTLRHTFASHFLRRHKDIRMLQEILGHSNITLTARYSHVTDGDKRQALEEYSQGLNLTSQQHEPSNRSSVLLTQPKEVSACSKQ